jgi:hypothetical protein
VFYIMGREAEEGGKGGLAPENLFKLSLESLCSVERGEKRPPLNIIYILAVNMGEWSTHSGGVEQGTHSRGSGAGYP